MVDCSVPYNPVAVESLVGKTLTAVEEEIGGDVILFTTSDGEQYQMWHSQDCCENVNIDDIVGNLSDLVGAPLLIAREDSNVPKEGQIYNAGTEYVYTDESFTWTFYNFATVKGYVTIKWYGSSNGYYSEGVDFDRIA